ncbi:MAG: winged helix-turn-helix transcriptional regulator [Anaerolineae bacterium]|nr:winged helix-turn-helix transcriptional regulator [Anaerolineae bacterium]
MSQDAFSLKKRNWLQQIGFVNGNPFATSEADRETRLLPEFFVDTGYYHLVWGDETVPQTTLLFAPRGGGKTAYRVMLQDQCCPASVDSNVLAVQYTSFEFALRELGERGRIDVETHIRKILWNGLPVLWDALCKNRKRAADFPAAQRDQLGGWLKQFAPASIEPAQVLVRIQSVEPEFKPSWSDFREHVQSGRLRELVSPVGNPVVQLIADVVESDATFSSNPLSASELLEGFVRLVQASTEIQAVYVLLDRLDETTETADSPETIVALLEPLLANLTLVEMAGLAFKLFLPRSVLSALRSRRTIRMDRFEIYDIEWEDRLLVEMLRKRLLTYSNSKIQTLAQICASPLAESIDQEIVKWVDGSPRQLLQLGKLLFQVHVDRPGEIPMLLGDEDWATARAIFLKEHLPLLRIDESAPQAFVGRRRISLTALEHSFLLALCRSGGWCEKEKLVDQVWGGGEGVTDQAVSRLVWRIREKIEPQPSVPTYLLTEYGFGFRLENAAGLSPSPAVERK